MYKRQALPLGAIAGAALATLLLASAAVRTQGMASLILVGVGLSSLAGALMALILNFAPNPFSLSDLVNWTLGSVAVSYTHLDVYKRQPMKSRASIT